MICKRCDEEFTSGKFCPKCGAPVTEPNGFEEETKLSGETVFSENTTVAAFENSTAIFEDGTSTAEGELDYDQKVAAPHLKNDVTEDSSTETSDKAATNKSSKKPMSIKKRVLVAVSSILAFLIVLSSAAVAVVAFTPKYKFILALQNTLFNTKSFDFEMKSEYLSVEGAVEFGETAEDTECYFVSESTGGSNFVTIYASKNESEFIIGTVSGNDGVASDGKFAGGKNEVLFEEMSGNEGVIANKKISEKSLEEAYQELEKMFAKLPNTEINLPEYEELKDILYGIFSKGIKDKAIEIKTTGIENGMTKYDVTVDLGELIESILDFSKENEQLGDFLDSRFFSKNQTFRDMLESASEIDFEKIEFTLGTKGMRFVHISTDDFELNMTNVNEEKDIKDYHNDIVAISEKWEDNYYDIKSYKDILVFIMSKTKAR